MKKILQKESPVLRGISKNIPVESITSLKIQKIIKEMKESLAQEDDGVAIAGPQIGYLLRIFVVSKKVGKLMNQKEMIEDLVFINPILKKISKKRKMLEEGCLSARWLYGKVSRSEKATIEAYDETGKKIERGGTGLLAQIFQHEMDHLDGILFLDKAKYVEELPPQNLK